MSTIDTTSLNNSSNIVFAHNNRYIYDYSQFKGNYMSGSSGTGAPPALITVLESNSINICNEKGKPILILSFTARGPELFVYESVYIPKQLLDSLEHLFGSVLNKSKKEIEERAEEGFLLEPDTDVADVISFVKDLGISVRD